MSARRRPRPAPPPQRHSARLLVRLAPSDVAMFRFLLESCENLAGFSVLERRPALLKLFFSPDQAAEVAEALKAIGETIPLQVEAWPLPPCPTHSRQIPDNPPAMREHGPSPLARAKRL